MAIEYPKNFPGGAPQLIFTPLRATYTTGANRSNTPDVLSKFETYTTKGKPFNQSRFIDTSFEDIDGSWIQQSEVVNTLITPLIQKTTMYEVLRTPNSGDVVALYMPRGLQISDSINYQNIQNGALVSGLEAAKELFDDTANAENIFTAENTSAFLSRSALGGEFLSGLRRRNLMRNQNSVNPREFALFDTPGLRQFQFQFKFIPDSADESDAVAKIIKIFRKAMYPEFAQGAGQVIYKFPLAFQIEYKNIVNKHMIKFPEVVLKDASVQYNQNSMSFYGQSNANSPVEIDLSLTFAELVPQSSEDIEAGF